MNAGIVLSYFNQRYFADTLSTICEFVPQASWPQRSLPTSCKIGPWPASWAPCPPALPPSGRNLNLAASSSRQSLIARHRGPSMPLPLAPPQMIFLNALFGYLCVLILLKWVTGSTADLYHTLIYMFLSVRPPWDAACSPWPDVVGTGSIGQLPPLCFTPLIKPAVKGRGARLGTVPELQGRSETGH